MRVRVIFGLGVKIHSGQLLLQLDLHLQTILVHVDSVAGSMCHFHPRDVAINVPPPDSICANFHAVFLLRMPAQFLLAEVVNQQSHWGVYLFSATPPPKGTVGPGHL